MNAQKVCASFALFRISLTGILEIGATCRKLLEASGAMAFAVLHGGVDEHTISSTGESFEMASQ